ncbi:MAG: hypothetical protein CMP51_00595 [Flavobacteriales bacterium]|nr:hypothetical protein [Flavobacteriales bacterium]|tara:strand:- start:1523 stop:2908 length:1386 start_codon:yes stop_codon:yes gene_type:complete
MSFLNFIRSRSIKDFLNLFFSNILQKILGAIRVPVEAVFFGDTFLFASYQMIRSGANLFSQFTVGNALKANLLPKFTKFYHSHSIVSLKRVFSFSNKSMLFLFVVSQIIQSFIILYIYYSPSASQLVNEVGKTGMTKDQIFLLLFIISVLLSFSICFNFFNMLYLTIMQARGQFFKYSVATTLNSFVVVILIIPLSYFLNIIGLVISRLLGIISLTLGYIIPMNKEKNGKELNLSKKDINIPILILGNFANIIIVTTQIVAGLETSGMENSGVSRNITYFYFSSFILNAVLTSVVVNISTLLLKKISVKSSRVWLYYSLGISIVLGLIMCLIFKFFNKEIVVFLYGNASDIMNYFFVFDSIDDEFLEITSQYLYQLSYSFLLIFIATTLFQPFFSITDNSVIKERNIMSIIFLSVLFLTFSVLFYMEYDVKYKSLLFIYISSFVSVILSIYSYFKYLKFEK